MPVQQQHHQLPQPTPSPTGRFSLECDRTNPGRPSSQSISTHNHNSSSSSSSSPTPKLSPSSPPSNRRSALAKNKTSNYLSSSAPSASSSFSTYCPFSSFEDDNDNITETATTPKPKRERPLSRNSSSKLQRQRWASWNNSNNTNQSARSTTSEQRPHESDLPSVQEERPPQQLSFLGVSSTTTAMTTDDNQDTPIASPISSKAVQTITGLANSSAMPHTTTTSTAATVCTTTTTTNVNNNYSTNPIMQTPTGQKSAKDRVAEREQRRHSSEDGLASYRRSASSSPPTSCIVDNINNNKYAIPPKCRMVFHMRDEVPRPREEDKTGLSEKRFYQYRPQPQPRGRIHALSSSSPDQNQEEGSMLSPLTSSQTPMKKPTSGKCAKMVSFKEPEPWRDVTPPPPSHQPPTSSSSTESEKQGDRHDTKQVRMQFTRLDVPSIMVTEAQQQHSASTPTVRRPMSEPILSSGSTMLSTLSLSSSSSAHRHTQASREKSSAPPLRMSSSSPPSSSVDEQPLSTSTSRHRRNLSMPVQSPNSSPSAGSNVPRRMQAGQGPMMVEEPKIKSGNKLLRLWRSATHKYGNHNHHHNHQSNGGVGFLGGKGSDLEPLVSLARE